MENVHEVPSVISAACVLHNFCLIADEGSIEEFLDLDDDGDGGVCLLYTSPSPRDQRGSRMPSSA